MSANTPGVGDHPFLERRHEHRPPSALAPIAAGILYFGGILLMVPNVAWVVTVWAGWVQDRVGTGLLVVTPVSMLLILGAAFLMHVGATRARASVGWLDRRVHGPGGTDREAPAGSR